MIQFWQLHALDSWCSRQREGREEERREEEGREEEGREEEGRRGGVSGASKRCLHGGRDRERGLELN